MIIEECITGSGNDAGDKIPVIIDYLITVSKRILQHYHELL